jgi:hypothetical protein
MRPKLWTRYFEHHASTYLDLGLSEDDFGRSQLPLRTAAVLKASFIRSITARQGMAFSPMFNFIYRDSHSMLSMGGMLGGSAERRRLSRSTMGETVYYRHSFDLPPFETRVPRLTRRERTYLDREMPCADSWVPAEFELDSQDVLRYRDIYRFMPAFAEILL